MVRISTDNTATAFRKFAGCTESVSTEFAQLISAAADAVGIKIDDKKYSDDWKECCELAAGAVAYYDYLCALASRNRIRVSEDGLASEKNDLSNELTAALKLREHSVERIKPLFYNSYFCFESMEG